MSSYRFMVRFIAWIGRRVIPLAACGGLAVAGGGCHMASQGYNTEGVRFFQQGQYSTAVTKFQQALANHPEDADAHYNLAATYHQMGKTTANTAWLQVSEELYHQAIDRAPNHVEAHRGLAALLVETDRSESAFEMMQRWVKANPTSADARLGLAQLYEEFGDLKTAQIQLNEAIALDPNHPRAWAAIGHLAERQGDAARALASYQKSLAANNLQPRLAERIASLQQHVVGGGYAAGVAGDTRYATQPTRPPR